MSGRCRFVVILLIFPSLSIGSLTIGDDVTVEKGDTAILECSYTEGIDLIHVAWHKGPEVTNRTKIIETNGNIVLVTKGYEHCSFFDGLSLKINGTKFDDEGRYWCEVQEEQTQLKYEGYLYLNVTEPVQDAQIQGICELEVHTDSDIVRSLTGLKTILHCAYTTSCSDYTLYWFKGTVTGGDQILSKRNGNIVTDEDVYGLVGQASLQIHAVSRSDQSIYTCQIAPFGTGDGSVKVDLKVTDPVEPKINTLELDPTVAIENNDISIKCNATGLPPPTYSWLLNDSPLPVEERYQLSESDSKITITNVKRSDHMSIYTCIGTNNYGFDKKSVQIEVHYQPNVPWPLCRNDSSTTGTFLQDGDEMTIICETDGGNPLPTLAWFNGSNEIQGEYNAEPECTWDCIATYTYTWILLKYDNGITCTCNGDHQETQTQGNCEVGPFDVKYSPEEPVCSDNATNYPLYKEGDHVLITCESRDGNPSATLVWFNETDQQELVNVSPDPEDSGSIKLKYDWEITRVDNQGEFRCEATNIVQLSPLKCFHGPLNVHFTARHVDLTGYNNPIVNGDRLVLTCTSGSSNPYSAITWYKNGHITFGGKYEEIGEDNYLKGEFHGIITQQNLTIDSKSEHNNVSFQCAAQLDQVESATSNLVTLEVFFPPSEPECCRTNISGYTGPLLEGEFLQLSCTSCSGNPAAEIKWFKNDMQLTLHTNETRELLDGAHNGKISHANLIEEVKHTDNGVTYRCEATSENIFPTHTYPSDDIVICVHYTPKIREQENGETIVVYEAEDAELVCNMTSNPSADIVWLDQNKEPIVNETNNRIIQETTRDTLMQSVLILHDVSRKDTGIYTCVANNSIGRATLELSVDVIDMGNFPTFAAIAISLAVIIIAASALLFIAYKRRHPKSEPTKEDETQADRNMYAELQHNREDRECDGKQEYMGLVFPKYRSVTIKDEPCYANKVCIQVIDNGDEDNGHGDRYEIPYRSIDFGQDISIGIFTKLMEANVSTREGKRIRVCVKILRENGIKTTENCLQTEARFMKTITKHKNILEMIYCCTKEIPNCVVFEYCSSGTLKYHLLTCKKETENVVEDSILRNLYSFALQIAKGMSYLEDIECVHRTLSSKSVHVDRGNICKITEFGLSSKVMTENTFETVTEGRLPIRWMALESILDCIYTSKTDVWSYGVVLWEIFTLGETPYSGITIRDIIKQLQQGYRLSKPDYSDERMFGIIQQCWLREAAERPTFHQLCSFIKLGYFQSKNHVKIYEDVPDEDTV